MLRRRKGFRSAKRRQWRRDFRRITAGSPQRGHGLRRAFRHSAGQCLRVSKRKCGRRAERIPHRSASVVPHQPDGCSLPAHGPAKDYRGKGRRHRPTAAEFPMPVRGWIPQSAPLPTAPEPARCSIRARDGGHRYRCKAKRHRRHHGTDVWHKAQQPSSTGWANGSSAGLRPDLWRYGTGGRLLRADRRRRTRCRCDEIHQPMVPAAAAYCGPNAGRCQDRCAAGTDAPAQILATHLPENGRQQPSEMQRPADDRADGLAPHSAGGSIDPERERSRRSVRAERATGGHASYVIPPFAAGGRLLYNAWKGTPFDGFRRRCRGWCYDSTNLPVIQVAEWCVTGQRRK